MDWEGAELCFYLNGESHSISLTNIQFAITAKVLGLSIAMENGEISYFSDDTLRQLATMKGNPLRLKENI